MYAIQKQTKHGAKYLCHFETYAVKWTTEASEAIRFRTDLVNEFLRETRTLEPNNTINKVIISDEYNNRQFPKADTKQTDFEVCCGLFLAPAIA